MLNNYISFLYFTIHQRQLGQRGIQEKGREFEETEGNPQLNLWTMMFPGAQPPTFLPSLAGYGRYW